MPELPEVETVVRGLAGKLVGRRITAVRVLHKPSIAGTPADPACVTGLRVQRVFRRAKFIRIELEAGMGMAIHLRMTGWLYILSLVQHRDTETQSEKRNSDLRFAKCDPAAVKSKIENPKSKMPFSASRRLSGDKHLRLWFELEGGQDVLVFRDIRTFGRVWCGSARALDKLPAIAQLGPEPLELPLGEFIQRLRARRGRLKALLLNQKFLAGIGNIYADEALFAARLHPLADASRVSARGAAALHRAIRRILAAAIKAGGSSISDFLHPDGAQGWFQRKLRVYGREGRPCAQCGEAIKRIVVGQRGTWFCPRCQRKR